MNANFIKKIYLVLAITLFISCLPFSIGFYTLSRLIVFITMTIIIYQLYNYKKDISTQIIIYSIIALLFNPLFPIYLNNKFLWILIDLGLGIYFFKKYKSI